ncbi:hypothetical protein BT67DRAFT_456140 [Trichocladium antarcticum]|uniref:Monopolin complex subunit Csm1/Pcs1 C-terminal domain-containing protein n=1 Tax=Trichocladium antarcticum TaxID=1450529 RepID=A0AAN6ZE51_9PEZI|nr:hypothetical protein BT67DRAFT_456140 [Trichocladium antarcticum]
MSKAKARSHLLRLVDSDSEDGFGGIAAVARLKSKPTTAQKSTMPPAKKAKAGRQAANRVTKPAPKTTASKSRTSGRILAAADESTAATDESSIALSVAPAKGPGRGRGRKRAAEKEEEDAPMVEEPATPPVKPKAARGRPKKVVIDAAEPQPAGARRGRKPAAKKAKPDATVEEVSEIPETQQPDLTQTDSDDDDQDDLERSVEDGRDHGPIPSSVSKRPPHTLSSDGGDPALRRRLGEMNQKYESLELKYRDLREVAVRESERNFDKLKKQSDEKSKAADQLIATLKSELAAQKEVSKETAHLRKQLDASDASAAAHQSQLAVLTTSLAESRSEIKSLHLKLSASRSAEAAAAASKAVPGSAMKGGPAGARLAAAASSEAAQAAQKKEDLYSDLTGLIVRSVRRDGGEDRFDCLQTGRNGTLHFKLAIEVGTDDGDAAHCHYTPQLDANRDRALIEVLPGFLVDEISFPPAQAGKFYARVLKALNEAPDGV